jgi:hypothetical protein
MRNAITPEAANRAPPKALTSQVRIGQVRLVTLHTRTSLTHWNPSPAGLASQTRTCMGTLTYHHRAFSAFHVNKAVSLEAWTGPQGSRRLRPPDFLTSAHEGGRLCQPYAPAAFTPRINLVFIFRGWVDPRAHGTVRCHEKTTATPGIDPGTFRLVAQCLNHYATPGPRRRCTLRKYLSTLTLLTAVKERH